jgi:hypothetical protein
MAGIPNRPTRPEPVPVPCDDFEMIYNGEAFYPHAGETVTALRGVRIGDFKLLQALGNLQVEIEALEPDDATDPVQAETARLKQLELLVPQMDEIGAVIKARVLSWTWTMPDASGALVPMPQPNAGGVELLTQEEAIYLLTVIRGETETEEKKDLSASPIISSDTDSPEAPKSSDMAPSQSKEFLAKQASPSAGLSPAVVR